MSILYRYVANSAVLYGIPVLEVRVLNRAIACGKLETIEYHSNSYLM